MGLAIDSVKGTFIFLRKYPKSFLFAALMYIPILLGVAILIFGFFVYGITANFLYLLPLIALGLAIVIASGLILSGGLPLLVAQAVESGKIEIQRAVKESFYRIGDLFITSLIMGLALLLIYLPITAGITFIFFFWAFPLVGKELPMLTLIIPALAVIALATIAGIYISIRLILAIPLLMIKKKRAIESLKGSWKITKGRVLSLIAASVLLFLTVTLPLALVGYLIGLLVKLAEPVWGAIESVVSATFGGILFAVYYYNLKEQEKL